MTTITVTGRATDDPKLGYTSSGKAYCSVSIADNHRKKENGEWQDDGATFYRCTAWEYQAEQLAELVRKGQRLIVVGDLRNREYEHNGEKRRSLEINIREIGVAIAKFPPRNNTNPPANTPSAPIGDPWGGGNTDIPF